MSAGVAELYLSSLSIQCLVKIAVGYESTVIRMLNDNLCCSSLLLYDSELIIELNSFH